MTLKKQWVNEFAENDVISDKVFLVLKKAVPVSKTNKAYLSLTLSDKTGTIECRMWDNIDSFKSLFDSGDYIRVSGVVNSYQNSLQLIVKVIEKMDNSLINPNNFLPASEYDSKEMIESLFEFIESMEDEHIKALIHKIFTNDYIFKNYVYSPAGKSIHHAFIHGLLEHSLSIASLCDKIVENYSELQVPINRDLLIAGALLHDIGKIYELDYAKGFTYTSEGQLIGHVVLGYQIMIDIANTIDDFPQKIKTHLGHLILSHQGSLEFGSPKTPMTLEAFILHSADEIDSKINMIINNVPKADEVNKKVVSDFLKSVDGYIVNSHDDIYVLKDSDITEKRKYLDVYKDTKEVKEDKSKQEKPKSLF